jgi:hypothetical protein
MARGHLPKSIKDELRREVGYVCPVANCGLPYLTWHHFDPPWEPSHIHRVEGMVALCAVHHGAADTGAYSDDQLRLLKSVRNIATVKGENVLRRANTVFKAAKNIACGSAGLLRYRGVPLVEFKTNPLTSEDEIYISSIDSHGAVTGIIEGNFWQADPVDYHIEATSNSRDLLLRKNDGSFKLTLKFRDAQAVSNEQVNSLIEHNGLRPKETRVCEFECDIRGVIKVDNSGIHAGGFHLRSGVSLSSGFLVEI